jgi:hypothetical protein
MSDALAPNELALQAIEVLKRIVAGEDIPALFVYADGGVSHSITIRMSEQQLIADLSAVLFDVQLQRALYKP